MFAIVASMIMASLIVASIDCSIVDCGIVDCGIVEIFKCLKLFVFVRANLSVCFQARTQTL